MALSWGNQSDSLPQRGSDGPEKLVVEGGRCSWLHRPGCVPSGGAPDPSKFPGTVTGLPHRGCGQDAEWSVRRTKRVPGAKPKAGGRCSVNEVDKDAEPQSGGRWSGVPARPACSTPHPHQVAEASHKSWAVPPGAPGRLSLTCLLSETSRTELLGSVL